MAKSARAEALTGIRAELESQAFVFELAYTDNRRAADACVRTEAEYGRAERVNGQRLRDCP